MIKAYRKSASVSLKKLTISSSENKCMMAKGAYSYYLLAFSIVPCILKMYNISYIKCMQCFIARTFLPTCFFILTSQTWIMSHFLKTGEVTLAILKQRNKNYLAFEMNWRWKILIESLINIFYRENVLSEQSEIVVLRKI